MWVEIQDNSRSCELTKRTENTNGKLGNIIKKHLRTKSK